MCPTNWWRAPPTPVSAKVKYTTGPATKTFDFAVQDGASKGAVMASGVATLGQWSTISGTYTVPSGKYDLTADHVVVETPYTSTPAADDLLDFSADDLSIVALAGPVITSVSVADGDSVKGTTTFQVNLGGAASDVSYTYIELNQNGAWITDNTTDSAKALGSTNSGLSPTAGGGYDHAGQRHLRVEDRRGRHERRDDREEDQLHHQQPDGNPYADVSGRAVQWLVHHGRLGGPGVLGDRGQDPVPG